MNDFEDQLRGHTLAKPSADLDRRMDELFGHAEAGVRPARRARSGWWLALLASAGATAATLLMLLRPTPPPVEPPAAPLVYQIEPQGLMREMLLTPPARLRTPPTFTVSVRQ